MKSCKLIVNDLSGNALKCNKESELVKILKNDYDVVDVEHITTTNNLNMGKSCGGYNCLAVCGGDGTLNSALNAIAKEGQELIYIPCGTLNDTAKSLKLAKELSVDNRKIRRIDIGEVNDTKFSYVCAGGTFTPIGYKTKIKTKKKVKVLAYLLMVLKEYKIHNIKANITANNKEGFPLFDNKKQMEFFDEYTLVMVVNSKRCFGFNFNKLFTHNDGKAQLILIKAPKNKGIIGKITVFFPFFRVFFMGVDKEINGKYIKYLTIDSGKIQLDKEYDFTIDGEKIQLEKENDIKIIKKGLKMVVF